LDVGNFAGCGKFHVADFALLVLPADFVAAVAPLQGALELHVGELLFCGLHHPLWQLIQRDHLAAGLPAAASQESHQCAQPEMAHQTSPMVSPPARVESARNTSLLMDVEMN